MKILMETIYSHSTVTFWYEGKRYSLKFEKVKEKIMWGRIMEHMSNIQGHMERRYGEGTKTDLDYGKLVILGLCIYIAIQVS